MAEPGTSGPRTYPPAMADAPTVVTWARSQGWQVQVARDTGRVRFAAPSGAFVASWTEADPTRLSDVITALRRYGLVWPPPPRRPRTASGR